LTHEGQITAQLGNPNRIKFDIKISFMHGFWYEKRKLLRQNCKLKNDNYELLRVNIGSVYWPARVKTLFLVTDIQCFWAKGPSRCCALVCNPHLQKSQ
jgi:hypothetical protein